MASFDFIHSKPATDWIAAYPEHLVASGLSADGNDYVAYLADARELSNPAAGKAIEGSISMALPPGNYDVSLYSPTTGQYSPAILVKGGATSVMALPQFTQDIVIRAVRRDN
jgi:hypothetical protein